MIVYLFKFDIFNSLQITIKSKRLYCVCMHLVTSERAKLATVKMSTRSYTIKTLCLEPNPLTYN